MKKIKLFLKSLSYDWYKYLLALIPIICVLTILSLNTRISYEEEIRIFNYIAPKEENFTNELKENFSDRGILNVYIQPYSIANDEFFQYLDVVGYEYSDLIILPESTILKNPNYYSSNSLHFGSSNSDTYYTEIKNKNPDIELYNYNDSPFGYFAIKIYKQNNDSYNSKIRINNFYNFEEDSVLSISKKSNKIENNIAFESLLYLI